MNENDRVYGCSDLPSLECCDSCHSEEEFFYEQGFGNYPITDFIGPDGKEWFVCCKIKSYFFPEGELDFKRYNEWNVNSSKGD